MAKSPPNSSSPTTAEIVGGVYNAAGETLVDGQGTPLQTDVNGNLLVKLAGSSGGATDVNIADVAGNPPALTNPLFVELSDGTQAVGTILNPLYATNKSVGVDGSPAPTSATEIGTIDASGNLQGVSPSNPVPVSIQGASSSGGAVKTIDGTPGTQYIFQEILMELRAMRKILMLVYEESGEGNLASDLMDDVNIPTEVDYN